MFNCMGPPGPGADQLRVTSDDLEDYCPSFDATPARARTNALRREFGADCFASSRARRKRPELKGQTVVPCMQGLVPGDLNAANWAQGAHKNLLASRGAYAAPIPESRTGPPFLEPPC